MRGPPICHCSIRLIPSRSRSASCGMHRKSPRTRTRRSRLVNTAVYVCNIRVNHSTQRLDAAFTLGTRFHPAAGAGRSCSVLDRQFDNSVRLTFDTGELTVIRKARAVWYGTGGTNRGHTCRVRLDAACERTESGSRHVRSVGARRRAELPGFRGAQDRDHVGRAAGLLDRQT
jgi:hypothetical protein